MKQPQISVIVPVYKAEAYLHRCIDSLLAQTFSDFELLLIDDGSPDLSGRICDEYAAQDTRIKVIHKQNGGVGSARQCGLDNATGEYTIHTDPDDWVEPNMLETLYQKAVSENADIVICDYVLEYANQSVLQSFNLANTDSHFLLNELVKGKLHGGLWNKLVRRSIIINNNINFTPGLNICEDLIFCIKLMQANVRVCYVKEALYHYDKHSNPNALTQLTTTHSKQQYDKWSLAFDEVMCDKNSRIYRTGYTYIAYWAFTHHVFSNKEYRIKYKNSIQSFIFNDRNIAIRIVTVLSALGLHDFIFRIYKYYKQI